jgi:hypothetical protein
MKKFLALSVGFWFLFALVTSGKANQIVGQVTDKLSGSPIAGVRIQILKDRRTTDYRTATDYEGKFSIINIPPASYEVSLFHPSYTKKLIRNLKVDAHYGTALTRTELAMEPVPPMVVSGIASLKVEDTLKLTPKVNSISNFEPRKVPSADFENYGRVTGQVLDKKTKEPIIGARVRLLFSDKTSARLGAITDEKGIFLILNVPSGTYDVEISFGPNYTKQLIKDVKIELKGIYNLGEIRLLEQAIEGDTIIINGGCRIGSHLQTKK